MMIKPVIIPKTQADINAEWDRLAPVRHEQIESNRDATFHDVIVPTIFDLCGSSLAGARVLDVGCGTGELTHRLAATAEHVVGVDPSKQSIAIATETEQRASVQFYVETIQDFCLRTRLRFDLAVASMVLMDCLDLSSVLESISSVMVHSSVFVFTITHPWYWPLYWGYQSESWFSYKTELIVESPFRITSESTSIVTTHIHRPLETYVELLKKHGFLLEQILEPVPPATASCVWKYPRYLAVRALYRGHD